MISKELNSRYIIHKLIADGGMSEVFYAYDKILDREVAIKKLKKQMYSTPHKIKKEVEFMLSLNHPNIVRIFDFFDEDDDVYIVMEYVEGKTLKELVQASGKMSVNNAIKYVEQICDALNYAHSQNIIHRDIKPQNIIIDADGTAKIIDFGIAKSKLSEETKTKSFFGSLYFVSPEQISGEQITEKTDIYSTGILLYYLLAGDFPFKGEKEYDVAISHMEKPIERITTKVSDVPQSVENVIIKATYKNPNNRYQTIGIMEQDLYSALSFDRENESPMTLNEQEYKEKLLTPNNKNNNNKRKKQIILISSLIAFCLVTLATLMLLFKNPKMPELKQEYSKEVVMEKFAEIKVDLKESNFEYENNETIPKNNFIKANLKTGDPIKDVTALKITISNGKSFITVENYIGQKYDEVASNLIQQGIIVSRENSRGTIGKFNEEEIISQSISPNQQLKQGDSITLTVKISDTIILENEEGKTPTQVQNKYGKYLLGGNSSIEFKENPNFEGSNKIFGVDESSPIKEGETIKENDQRRIVFIVGKNRVVEPTPVASPVQPATTPTPAALVRLRLKGHD